MAKSEIQKFRKSESQKFRGRGEAVTAGTLALLGQFCWEIHWINLGGMDRSINGLDVDGLDRQCRSSIFTDT